MESTAIVKVKPGTSPLARKLAEFLLSRIPLVRKTIFKELVATTPLSTASFDVDQIHAILDGTDFGQTNEYFALCDTIVLTDSHLQGELAKRKLAILGDQYSIDAVDPKNAQDVEASKYIKEMVEGLPSFIDGCGALLDGVLWPLAMVEKVFRPARVNKKLNFELVGLTRVPPRLFDYSTGYLRIWDTDPQTGTIMGTRHDADPMRYMIHRGHLLTTPDYRGGPMRSLIFWSLFSNFDRDWWARFLDRFGAPFLVGKYDQADDDSRIVLQNAFQLATKIGGIVVSKATDIELQQAQARGGADGFDLFFKACQREKSKLIVGQTTSADAEHGGMSGSGVAKEQAQVRGDIRQFDSIRLGNTLRYQLFNPFLRINGIPGRVKITWGGEEAEDIASTAQAVSFLDGAGLEVTDDGIATLGRRIGIPLQRKAVPDPGQDIPGGKPAFRRNGQAQPARKMSALSTTPAGDRYQQADDSNGRIASGAAADLSRAFRGVFAPIGQFVRDSSSPEELIAKIESHYSGWDPTKVAGIVVEALAAFSANGAVRDAVRT
jgi:phage gp29-like protein